MKKAIILFALVLLAIQMQAQVKVFNNGNILLNGNGATSAYSPLSIGGVGLSDCQVHISANNKRALNIQCASGKDGVKIGTFCSNSQSSKAIDIFPSAGIYTSSTFAGSIEAFGPVTDQGTSVGICGKFLSVSGYIPTNVAGLYGSSSVNTSFAYPGVYAGYFNGDVRVTGTIYGTLLTPTSTSSNVSSNVTSTSTKSHEETVSMFIPDDEDSYISSKLRNVQLLQFYQPNSLRNTTQQYKNRSSIDYPAEGNAQPLTPEQFEQFIADNSDAEPIQTQMASLRYGLAADQLKKVFPELVYEDEHGNVSINYMEMIPLLVEALNELQGKVETLEKEKVDLSNLANVRSEATSLADAETDILSLDQNEPNPFSETTSIGVKVPESVKTANIFIYDMSGKEIKRMAIAARGKTRVSVAGSDLTSGMYLYSLIADGKVVSTKRMILAK